MMLEPTLPEVRLRQVVFQHKSMVLWGVQGIKTYDIVL